MIKTNRPCKMHIAFLFLMVLFAIISPIPLQSQNPTSDVSTTESSKLTGSDQKTEDAVSASDVIFIGDITKLGAVSLRAPGKIAYHNVQVSVIRTLKGTVETPNVTISIAVRKDVESVPKAGTRYIFLTKGNNGTYTVYKLILFDEGSSASIQSLISKS